jgi:hypothetical protein
LFAANFYDFWRQMLNVKDAEFNLFADDIYLEHIETNWAELLNEMESHAQERSKQRAQDFERIQSLLLEKFNLKAIENPTQYKENILQEREKKITIPTNDKVGIIYEEANLEVEAFDYTHVDESQVKAFLKKVNRPSRMRFYRDVVDDFSLNERAMDIVIRFLEADQFLREAGVLKLMKKYGYQQGF